MDKKIAIIFGGTRGIGAACVEALAADGFHVAYTCTSGVPVSGERTRAYSCDIRDAAEVAKVFAGVKADFGGRPQCVVANAGINVPPAPLAQFPAERFRDLVEVSFLASDRASWVHGQVVQPNGGMV